ncbi:MAG: hypothetical protein ACRD3E_02500 [Terriglobales bacterium]
MRFAVRVVLCCSLALSGARASDIAVFCSPDLAHAVTTAHAAAIERDVAREYGLRDTDTLPNMVIFITTREGARTAGIPVTTPIVVDHVKLRSLGGASVYHIWLIDTSNDAGLAKAIATAINDDIGAGKTAKEITELTRHVCTRLQAKVSVGELADQEARRIR